jgi:hypothetical protein
MYVKAVKVTDGAGTDPGRQGAVSVGWKARDVSADNSGELRSRPDSEARKAGGCSRQNKISPRQLRFWVGPHY